jgi:hypothetical protein
MKSFCIARGSRGDGQRQRQQDRERPHLLRRLLLNVVDRTSGVS